LESPPLEPSPVRSPGSTPSSRLKWILASVFGSALLVVLGLAINNRLRPEWMRNDAPEWARVTESEDSVWYINTRFLATGHSGSNHVIFSMVKDVPKIETAKASIEVSGFDCRPDGALMQRFSILIVHVDPHGEPLGEAFAGSDAVSIPQGSIADSLRTATCSLATRVAPTKLPRYTRPPDGIKSVVPSSILGDPFEEDVQPAEVGQVTIHGKQYLVLWNQGTHQWDFRYRFVGDLTSSNGESHALAIKDVPVYGTRYKGVSCSGEQINRGGVDDRGFWALPGSKLCSGTEKPGLCTAPESALPA
jgi:hypothetical protein